MCFCFLWQKTLPYRYRHFFCTVVICQAMGVGCHFISGTVTIYINADSFLMSVIFSSCIHAIVVSSRSVTPIAIYGLVSSATDAFTDVDSVCDKSSFELQVHRNKLLLVGLKTEERKTFCS